MPSLIAIVWQHNTVDNKRQFGVIGSPDQLLEEVTELELGVTIDVTFAATQLGQAGAPLSSMRCALPDLPPAYSVQLPVPDFGNACSLNTHQNLTDKAKARDRSCTGVHAKPDALDIGHAGKTRYMGKRSCQGCGF